MGLLEGLQLLPHLGHLLQLPHHLPQHTLRHIPQLASHWLADVPPLLCTTQYTWSLACYLLVSHGSVRQRSSLLWFLSLSANVSGSLQWYILHAALDNYTYTPYGIHVYCLIYMFNLHVQVHIYLKALLLRTKCQVKCFSVPCQSKMRLTVSRNTQSP